ncbi:hypothetical protein RRG08_056832 [Elysia crispata]|uniref:Uncharacterized protein n=1 Tax=Elysia crispata TaxID=231223 RepID=A0AAE1DW34_9GAST|nr:hypothetical protein RRG08_056832 [Elysia crispata]
MVKIFRVSKTPRLARRCISKQLSKVAADLKTRRIFNNAIFCTEKVAAHLTVQQRPVPHEESRRRSHDGRSTTRHSERRKSSQILKHDDGDWAVFLFGDASLSVKPFTVVVPRLRQALCNITVLWASEEPALVTPPASASPLLF